MNILNVLRRDEVDFFVLLLQHEHLLLEIGIHWRLFIANTFFAYYFL